MNGPAITVSRDTEGLKGAMLELLEQSLAPARREEDEPASNYSPGYVLRLEYLTQLKAMIDAGMEIALFADEVDGFRAMKEARAEFDRDHPSCGHCGVAQWTKWVQACRECGAQFKRSA